MFVDDGEREKNYARTLVLERQLELPKDHATWKISWFLDGRTDHVTLALNVSLRPRDVSARP